MVRAVFWGVRQAICTETCRGSRPFADRFLEGWLCPKCWLSVPLIYRWLELFGAHRVLPPSSVNGKSLWCVLLYWGCGKSSWKWLGTRLKLMKLKIYCKEFSKLLNVGQSYRRIGSLHYGGLHLPGERAGHGRANVAICCHSGENSWEKTQEIGETIEKKGNFTILAFVARGGFRGGVSLSCVISQVFASDFVRLLHISSHRNRFHSSALRVSNCRWRSISEIRRSGNDVNLQWFMRARVGRWRMWSQDL